MKKWIGIMLTLTLVGVLIGTVIIPATAQGGESVPVPLLINYQGYLTDSIGETLDGWDERRDMVFKFYGQDSGGTAYITVQHEDIALNDGSFNLLIGSGIVIAGSESSLADVFKNHTDVWMGVTVGLEPNTYPTDDEMTPRIRMTSVPFAFNSEYANTANSAYALDAADGSPEDAVYVDNGGKVGIGTTSPDTTLHVVGDRNAQRNQAISPGYATFIDWISNDGSVRGMVGVDGVGYSGMANQFSIASWTNHPMVLFTNTTERMRISNNGNVGIGTTTPQSTLEVDGYIQLDTVTSAPPAADCNEESECGRMKFDGTSDVLYICSGASGWVTK